MTASTPSAHIPALKLTANELVGRTARFGSDLSVSQPGCSRPIWVGTFFDGTNNNKKRDQEDIPDPAKRSHSNVVVLHDAFRDDAKNGYFKNYMPGVGTPFEQIGEMTESADGKAMAYGGEARIYWAMIQLYNAIHRAAGSRGRPLVTDAEASRYINGSSFLATKGMLKLPATRRRGFYDGLSKRLRSAIQGRRPSVSAVNLSVFGFSRGAAEARTFCNWIVELCSEHGSELRFCGIPIRFQFLGIFDTVASVGFADSTPLVGSPGSFDLVDGLMGWADGTLDIPPRIERCVHYVAAHEVRKSFPLSSVRRGKTYPPNCHEVVYPGAHSDVGGGYAPGEQGKSLGGRDRLVSQIALANMYAEARRAGVPLLGPSELAHQTLDEVIGDLQVAPELAQSFREYATWSKASSASVEDLLFKHMRLYWRWRLKVAPRFEELTSVRQANAQDSEDLRASERDFQRDMLHVMQRKRQTELLRQRRGATPPPLSPLYAAAAEEACACNEVPQAVHEFFDRFIHDSHASFYLAGPVTAYDKAEKLKLVKEKQRRGKTLTPFEQRMLELDATRPGEFPVMTDGDFEDLLDLESASTEAVVKAMTATRRESDGHVRVRVVFDES